MDWLHIAPSSRLVSGTLLVPVSKYHLHRALILASCVPGQSRITGTSSALHIRHTLRALRDLGVAIEVDSRGYTVAGKEFDPPEGYVRVGSSGSTVQFLLGLCSLSPRPVTLAGTPALTRRPLRPLLQSLARYGVKCQARSNRLPITVVPGRPAGGSVKVSGAMSQWASGLLLAAPHAVKDTHLSIVPPIAEKPYVELTWRMLQHFGMHGEAAWDTMEFDIPAQASNLHAADYIVPPDFSSLAFPLAYLALHGGTLTLEGFGNPAEHPEGGIIPLMEAIGVQIDYDPNTRRAVARASGQVRPFSTSVLDTPDLLPVLCVLASAAPGRSVISDIQSNRHKESNRVEAMLQLRAMGVQMDETERELIIRGGSSLLGTTLSSYNDHRVLMAFAVAGSIAQGTTFISHPYAYRISYPQFLEDMSALGMQATCENGPQALPEVYTERSEQA